MRAAWFNVGCLLLAVLLWLTLPTGTLLAEDPPLPALTGRVVDRADVLAEGEEARLTQKLAEVEHGTGAQIVVATLPSLGSYSIESWGLALGRSWKIGHIGKDDGVIIVVAPNDREVRIEIGYGLEGSIPDASADKIVRGILLPAFRDGHYAAGLDDAIDALKMLIIDPSSAVLEQNAHTGVYLGLLLVSSIIALLLLAFRAFPLGKDLALANAQDADAFSDDNQSSWHTRTLSSNLRDVSSGSRETSFSGHGGSFGGGGASGRW